MPNDSHRLLTEPQRRHVGEATQRAEQLRNAALHEVELMSTARDGVPDVDISPGSGEGYKIYRKAELDGVRLMLTAEIEAFRGAGLFGKELRDLVLGDTLESLEGSFVLTKIEKRLLESEANLHREDFDIPEWLLVPKSLANSAISPYCQLSSDAIRRLKNERAATEERVDMADRSTLGQQRGNGLDEVAAADRAQRFVSACIQSYVQGFADAVTAEWSSVIPHLDPVPPSFEFIGNAILQLAVEHTLISHKLHYVQKWTDAAAPSREYVASLLKGLASSSSSDVPLSDRRPSSTNTEGHRELVDKYLADVKAQTGRAITRRDFWAAAGYKNPTEFQRWQRNDPRTTLTASSNFARVLKSKPHLKK